MTTELTKARIITLSREAAEAGDLDMVDICRRALDGDKSACSVCIDVLDDADDAADPLWIVDYRDEFEGWIPIGRYGTDHTGPETVEMSMAPSPELAEELRVRMIAERSIGAETRIRRIGAAMASS